MSIALCLRFLLLIWLLRREVVLSCNIDDVAGGRQDINRSNYTRLLPPYDSEEIRWGGTE